MKPTSNQLVFFLGGHDAEMVEIRRILQEKGIPFFDRDLAWGARLSAYTGELATLRDEQVPVFVELKLDCVYPERAVIIDHHNEMAGENTPASLEQVAELLGVELNRKQKLIAANDRGYIDAMWELCATKEEIEEIRRLDQDAQGVTEEDRKLARESIEKGMRKIGPSAVVIEARTNRTAPILDALYGRYEHIFVQTPNGGLHYSGIGEVVNKLREKYEQLKKNQPSLEFWWGGNMPKKGYFGATETIREETMAKIIEGDEENIISHHIFMFPFTLKPLKKKEEKKKKKKEGEPQESTTFVEDVTNVLRESNLEVAEFKIEGGDLPFETRNLRYSEYFYFHEFIRDAIYYNGYNGRESDAETTVKVFKRPLSWGAKFIITLRNGNTYELKLKNIYLYVYETQVGILTFELLNEKYSSIEDVMRINDSGRRVYPPFLGTKNGVIGTKEAFLPECVRLILGDGKHEFLETFPLKVFRKDHLEVAGYIRELLGKGFRLYTSRDEEAHYEYSPTIDDRMYVVCWYGSNKWSRILKRKNKRGRFFYETSDMWYRFMYHDGSFLNCQHPEMMRQLIEKSTYKRWANFGTFYGITRYSLTCLTSLDAFNYNVIREHMRRHYAHMARLLLALRASILKFSVEVAEISDEIKKRKGEQEVGKDISDLVEELHARYIRFINRMWFPEITPQEQGIEMYHQGLEVMRLHEEIQNLKDEIRELYEYVELSYERHANDQVNILTILGAIFMPLMLITGILGINNVFMELGIKKFIVSFCSLYHPGGIGPDLPCFWILPFVFSLIAFILVVLGGYWLMRRYLSHMGIGKKSEIYKYLTVKGIWDVIWDDTRGKSFKNHEVQK